MLYLTHTQQDESVLQGHYQWLRSSPHGSGGLPSEGQGNLLQAAQVLDKKSPVTLILPAYRGVLAQVDIPSQRNKQIRSALPFLMQKRLLEDASQFYFAWRPDRKSNKKTTHNSLLVAGYPQVELYSLISECAAQGLKVNQVILDAQLLPANTSNTWTLLADGDYWLLNYGAYQCCSIEHANFFAVVMAQALETSKLTGASALDEWQNLPPTQLPQEALYPSELLQAEQDDIHAGVTDSENAHSMLGKSDHHSLDITHSPDAETTHIPTIDSPEEVDQLLSINVLGQSAQDAVIKLQDQGWPVSAMHVVSSSLYKSRVALLHEFDFHGHISLVPKAPLSKTKLGLKKLRFFCMGSGRSVAIWASYCMVILVGILMLSNQQLEHNLSRAKDTYAQLAPPLEAQLDRLAVPQTLAQRVAILQKLHPSYSHAFTLLDIWGNVKSYLNSQVSLNAWAVNSMQYSDNRLIVTWKVGTIEQAQAEANAMETGTWAGRDQVSLEWHYADAVPGQLMTLNLILLETAL